MSCDRGQAGQDRRDSVCRLRAQRASPPTPDLAPPLEQLAIAVFEEQVVDDLLDELSRLGSLVCRASLDLATLGLKVHTDASHRWRTFAECGADLYRCSHRSSRFACFGREL